jgi:hypothetical protein
MVVDCVLLHVAVRKKTGQGYRNETIAVLKEAGLPRLFLEHDHLNYVDTAHMLTEQGLEVTEDEVLQLFALGHFLKLWELVPPEDIGVPSSTRGSFAVKGGVVMISNFQLAAFA